MSFLVAEPITITPAMVVANTLAESLPLWNAGTTYADKARAISPDGLSVVESLQAGNTAHDPSAEDPDAPEWWERVCASNRWAIWDHEISLPSLASGSFSVTVRPGAFSVIGLHGMRDISSVRIQLVNLSTGAVVRDSAHDLLAEGIDTALEFFYVWPRPTQVQQVFVGLPMLSSCELTLTFSGGADMRIGEIVLGPAYELGDALDGASIGMADYSTQERDKWGRLTLQQGDFSRKGTQPWIFDKRRLAKVHALLSRFRGKPCLYIPSVVPGYEPMAVLGTYTRLNIGQRTTQKYVGSVDLEGLSESI